MGHLFDQVFGEAKHKGLEKQIEKRIRMGSTFKIFKIKKIFSIFKIIQK